MGERFEQSKAENLDRPISLSANLPVILWKVHLLKSGWDEGPLSQ
jgi:hypothetical protein